MNPKNLVSFALLLTIACFQWMCSTEMIGPQEPSKIPTTEIVDELANARTQAEAELAITHLLQKTGVGMPIAGSKYQNYTLSDERLSILADSHLEFLGGSNSISLHEAFNTLMGMTDILQFNVDSDQVFTRLDLQASNALLDKEQPNNALLLTIVADESGIPNTIPGDTRTVFKSPLQAFLFGVWVDTEFENVSVNKGNLSPKECLKGCKAEFFACFFTGGNRKSCLAEFKECRQNCTPPHDQGGGN